MSLTVNKTVNKFIKEFENEFGPYLGKPHKIEPRQNSPRPVYSAKFSVCPPKNHKYSDWDLACQPTKDLLVHNPKIILQMDKFIRQFPLFSLQGQLVTTLDVHKEPEPIFHHIDRLVWLHFMAFIPGEKTSPFTDIHLNSLSNEALRQLYSRVSGKEFIEWIMITCWRKFLLKGNMKYEKWVLPVLSSQEQNRFKSKPNHFIPEYLKSNGSKDYTELINYLNSVQKREQISK